jgi:hypothetical protein
MRPRRLLLVLLCIVSLLAPACAPSDSAAVEQAARAYVQAESGLTETEVEVEAVEGDFARARSTPRDDAMEPAVVFLQRRGGQWQGIVMGTAFSPEDYGSLGIPPGLRI